MSRAATPADVIAGAARWAVAVGDALDVVRALPVACLDAVVTDPPSGIAFMGAEWDRDKGGRAQWVAWLAGILAEARRCTHDGGRSVVVEAKSFAGRLSRLDIPEHQRAHLDACAALGGLALLALEVRGCGVYVVRWDAAPWRVTTRTLTVVESGRKVQRPVESRTLGVEELAGHRVEGECYLRKWAK